MDQEKQNQNTANTSGAQEASASAASHTNPSMNTETSGKDAAPSFDQLMAQSSTLSPMSGWIKCLRKPALSMQYSLQKRHVPDLDADTEGQSQGASGTPQSAQGGQSTQSGQSASPSSTPTKAGQNSDTMGLTGGFTIRYFDLAMGAFGLMMLGCLLKGCCFLKRKIF